MNINFMPTVGNTRPPLPRAIPPVGRFERPLIQGLIKDADGAQVTKDILALERMRSTPGSEDEGLRLLLELPINYFIALKLPKAAQAAVYLYDGGLTSPANLLTHLASAIRENITGIQLLETERGLKKEDDDRLTLGGILNPGLVISNLDDPGFTEHSIREALLAALRDGNGHLKAMFGSLFQSQRKASSSTPAPLIL